MLFQEVLEDWAWSEQLLWADALVICRLPATFAVLRTIAAARSAGLPVCTTSTIWWWIQTTEFVLQQLRRNDHPQAASLAAIGCVPVCCGVAGLRCRHRGTAAFSSAGTSCNRISRFGCLPIWRRRAPPGAAAAPSLGTTASAGGGQWDKAHKQIWMEELAYLVLLLERNPSLQLDLLGHLQLPLLLQPRRADPLPSLQRLQHLPRAPRQANIGLVALDLALHRCQKRHPLDGVQLPRAGQRPQSAHLHRHPPGRASGPALPRNRPVGAAGGAPAGESRRDQGSGQTGQGEGPDVVGPHVGERFSTPLIANGSSASPKPRRRKLLVLNVYFAPESVEATVWSGPGESALCPSRRSMGCDGPLHRFRTLAVRPRPPDVPEESAQPWLQQQPIPFTCTSGRRPCRAAGDAATPWREQHDLSLETLCRWWLPRRFDQSMPVPSGAGNGAVDRGQGAWNPLPGDPA